MLIAVADTHTVIWYLFGDPRLSSAARDVIDGAGASGNQVGVATITLAEIVYLSEKGRIRSDVFWRVLSALDEPSRMLTEISFDRTVAIAMTSVDRADVPDLPDRMIAATAHRYGVPLITRDHRIRTSGLPTIW